MSSLALHACQVAALRHVASYARARGELARRTLDDVCALSNIAAAHFEEALRNIRQHARIALHFHPDRPDAQQRSVAENLLDCGTYKSQLETLLSNGSVTAFPGGERE